MGQQPKILTPHLGPEHELGAEMRALRERQRLSLKGLQSLIRFSAGYIARCERADQRPSADLITACDHHLGANGSLIRRYRELFGDRDGSVGPRVHVSNPESHVSNGHVSLASGQDPQAVSGQGFSTPARTLQTPGPLGPAAEERPSGLVVATGQPDADRELISLAARRAKSFAMLANQGNLTAEALDQIHDDVRRLAYDYPQRPLSDLLGDLVQTQETLYNILENRQRPDQARKVYFLTGVVGGLLAKASHDLADPHAAMAQARTAFLCADHADHNGLRAWIRSLQALVSYWAGRHREAINFTQSGTEYALRSRSTSAVSLPINEARSWAALGNSEQAYAAIRRAEDAWDHIQPDEVDELGGLCTFNQNKTIYYAADALAWLPAESSAAQEYAQRAVDAYADESSPDWAFGDQAGSRSDLAIARVSAGELEGAAEAVAPILELDPEHRINGIITSAQRVHKALSSSDLAVSAGELQEQIELFTRTPLKSLPR